MKNSITIILFIFISLATVNAKPFLNSEINQQSQLKSLINPNNANDSLITSPRKKYTFNDNKNFFSINLIPIFMEGASSLVDKDKPFSNQKSNFQFIQFQLFYERKITEKSSIELVFSKKNPVNTSLKQYTTFLANNPYGEILAMKSSESYMGGVFYKGYITKRFYLSPGFIYRNSWFNNQSVKWNYSANNERFDVKREDFSLRFVMGYKFKFKMLGDKSFFLDCYTGSEIQVRNISINNYKPASNGNTIVGNEYISDWTYYALPQVGIKLGFGW